MVSVLTKLFGTNNLQMAEDVVQQTFMEAMQTWGLKGVPKNPAAWLYRVAKNKAIDLLRRNRHTTHFDSEPTLLDSEYTLSTTVNEQWNETNMKDDMLQMMFACCDPGISTENQITLILKTLCGFSTAEIAKAFVTTEDTISKRLYRTKEYYRKHNIAMQIPPDSEIRTRTDGVLNAIYLLFNEGYNSSHSDDHIRTDLMAEAAALCKLLTENTLTGLPQTFALMALIHFHAARNHSRTNGNGEIVLLHNQDRSKWNNELIDLGNVYMNKAAFGNQVSAYHIEAAIAYEHCIAPNFEQTNWQRLLELYDWLCQVRPTYITQMNRAIVILHLQEPQDALAALTNIPEQQKLETYYLYHSLLGEIHSRLNNPDLAITHFQKAISLTASPNEQLLLKQKIKKMRC